MITLNDYLYSGDTVLRIPDSTVPEDEGILQIYGKRVSVYGIYLQGKDQITDPCRRKI